jgi:surfeit locus 1 family protein
VRVGAFRFAPRLVPTLAAAVMLALLLSLGRWQVQRAHEKETRQALFDRRMAEPAFRLAGALPDPQTLLFRRVLAEGHYIAQGQVFIDNRQHLGRPGFHVVTPLKLDGSAATVLVNRGWVARTAAYPKPPEVPVPEGVASVSGVAATPPARVLELSKQTIAGTVWQNLSIAKYRERARIDVLPYVVLASVPAPGLAAVEEKPDAGVAKHVEYALTWFSLAALVAVLWIALNVKREG